MGLPNRAAVRPWMRAGAPGPVPALDLVPALADPVDPVGQPGRGGPVQAARRRSCA